MATGAAVVASVATGLPVLQHCANADSASLTVLSSMH
jgi:hypothetical protein